MERFAEAKSLETLNLPETEVVSGKLLTKIGETWPSLKVLSIELCTKRGSWPLDLRETLKALSNLHLDELYIPLNMELLPPLQDAPNLLETLNRSPEYSQFKAVDLSPMNGDGYLLSAANEDDRLSDDLEGSRLLAVTQLLAHISVVIPFKPMTFFHCGQLDHWYLLISDTYECDDDIKQIARRFTIDLPRMHWKQTCLQEEREEKERTAGCFTGLGWRQMIQGGE